MKTGFHDDSETLILVAAPPPAPNPRQHSDKWRSGRRAFWVKAAA